MKTQYPGFIINENIPMREDKGGDGRLALILRYTYVYFSLPALSFVWGRDGE